ncbi:MAG: nitroreductase [Pseudomonadota bacterium]
MPASIPDLMTYLKTRRSSLSLTLEAPGPSREQIEEIVTVASRVPDHGKLAPWRFEAWSTKRREALHAALSQHLHINQDRMDGEDTGKLQQQTDKLLHGPTLLVCVSTAKDHPKIPLWEQHLSAGAACMNTLMAANALGFEAQWLTAWYVYDETTAPVLGLGDGERIAGLIHIGSTNGAKSERPRPPLETILKHIEE